MRQVMVPHPFNGATFVSVDRWWVRLALRLPASFKYPHVEFYKGMWGIHVGPFSCHGCRETMNADLITTGGTVFWYRLFGRGLQFKGPGSMVLFSERYGYRPPLLQLRGWRVFPVGWGND